MKFKLDLVLLLLVVFFPLYLSFCHQTLVSAPPTSVRDVLSNSQLSYFARILSATQGQSIITIGSTNGPSLTTSNLDVGDTIGIGTTGVGVGTTGPLSMYTVADLGSGNTNTIELNAGIGQSNTFVGAAVISTHAAVHTVSWTPQSNATGGYWQFLIRASNRQVGATETYNDGIPDQEGFDLGQDIGATNTGLGTRVKLADVACPSWSGVGTTQNASSIGTTLIGTAFYNVFNCYLGVGNTNQVGTSYTVNIGRPLTVGSELINPSPADGVGSTGTSHIEGNADLYTFYVRHLDSTAALITADTSQGKIAMIEAVRVTATIDPTLTFTIDAGGIGTTACGIGLLNNNSGVNGVAVPFGSLKIGTTDNDLAQRLGVITNGAAYVVTVYENNVMHNITDGTTLPDTVCDNTYACSTSTPNKWDSGTNGTSIASGFGYSLQNINVGTSAFDYKANGYQFNAKPFGVGSAQAQTVMSRTGTPLSTDYAAVCYRIISSTLQKAGNYDDEISYTATATF